MATVNGYTAERMKAIEDKTIVDGNIIGDDLVLVAHDGSQQNAGNVRGPAGSKGDTGDVSQAQLSAATGTSADAGNDIRLGVDGKVYYDHDKAYAHHVTIFASAAARDAAITAPSTGMGAYLIDVQQLTFYYGSNVKWKPAWNQPWGMVGNFKPANFTFSTTVGQSAQMTVLKVRSDRSYRVSIYAEMNNQLANNCVSRLYLGTTSTLEIGNYIRHTYRNQNSQEAVSVVGIWNAASTNPPTTGDTIVRLYAISSLDASVQAVSGCNVIFEDIGPSTIPVYT